LESYYSGRYINKPIVENSNLSDFKTFLFLHKGGSLSIAEGFQVDIVLLELDAP